MIESHSALIAGVCALASSTLATHLLIKELRQLRYRRADDEPTAAPPTTWLRWTAPASITLIALAYFSARPAFAVLGALYAIVLAALTVIDLDVRRLPDVITLPTAAAVATFLMIWGAYSSDWMSVGRSLLAGLTLAAGYFALALIGGGRGMGLGDAKLALSLGMILGQLGWVQVLAATVVTFTSAALLGLWLILFRGANGRTKVAFGPFMALGGVVVLALPAWASLPAL